jgi:hypothetical protein
MNGRPPAFEIRDSALITLALGRKAHDLRELRDQVAEIPRDSLLHHFYDSLLRPSFDDPEYRNDFALWARGQLHDHPLAERLGLLDPSVFADAEVLREEMLEILDDRLTEVQHVPAAAPGHEFHFLRSQLIVFTTGLSAADPVQLAALVPNLTAGSVFIHFVDARLREPRGSDDFSNWLADWGPEAEGARQRLTAIDPLFGSLRLLRTRIAAALSAEPIAVLVEELT